MAFSRNRTGWECQAQKTPATRVVWSHDNFLSADWLNCDGNAKEWTYSSGSWTTNSYGMRLAKNQASTCWDINFWGMEVTKIMLKADQQNRMTATIHYLKNTDRLKTIPDYSLQIKLPIGQIPESELSSF